LTGVYGAEDHELPVTAQFMVFRSLDDVTLLVTACPARKVRNIHISQYLKFQGILEFIGRQLAASSMIFSQPAACSVADVFSGSAAT